jgi:hypothetical protein
MPHKGGPVSDRGRTSTGEDEAMTKKDLEQFGVDVDGALVKVKALHEDHHQRYPKDAKKHVPLPIEKVQRVAVEAVAGADAKFVKDAVDSLAALLAGSIESK